MGRGAADFHNWDACGGPKVVPVTPDESTMTDPPWSSYRQHPSWSKVLASASEWKARAMVAEQRFADFCRRCENATATTSQADNEAAAKTFRREKDKARTKIKAVLHALDDVALRLGEAEEGTVEALRKDAEASHALVERHKDLWLSRMANLRRWKRGENVKYQGAIDADEAAVDCGILAYRGEGNDKHEELLERLSKAEALNKALNKKLAMSEKQNRRQLQENELLHLQMRGVVDSIKKKSERAKVLESKLKLYDLADKGQGQPRGAGVVGNGTGGETPPAAERRNGHDETYVAVPKLEGDTSLVPFAVVSASRDGAFEAALTQIVGKGSRCAQMEKQADDLVDLLQNEARNLPAWTGTADASDALVKAVEYNQRMIEELAAEDPERVSNELLACHASLAAAFEGLDKQAAAGLGDSRSFFAAHIARVSVELEAISTSTESPLGWVQDERAVQKFVHLPAAQAVEVILKVVLSYKAWLRDFLARLAPAMQDTDRKLQELHGAVQHERRTLEEHVGLSHSGLQLSGNVLSIAKALLQRLSTERKTLESRSSSVAKSERDVEGIREAAERAIAGSKAAPLFDAYATFQGVSKHLESVCEKRINLNTKLRLHEVSGRGGSTVHIQSALGKLDKKCEQLQVSLRKTSQYLKSHFHVSDETLAAAAEAPRGRSGIVPLLNACELRYQSMARIGASSLYYAHRADKPVLVHKLGPRPNPARLLLKLREAEQHPCVVSTTLAFESHEEGLVLEKPYLVPMMSLSQWLRYGQDEGVILNTYRELLQGITFLRRHSMALEDGASNGNVFVDTAGAIRLVAIDVLEDVGAEQGERGIAPAPAPPATFIAMSMHATRKADDALATFGVMLFEALFPEITPAPSPAQIDHHLEILRPQLRSFFRLVLSGPATDGAATRAADVYDQALAHAIFSGR